ncbi:hypothetical protein [Parasphingorhabdus sp. NYA22]
MKKLISFITLPIAALALTGASAPGLTFTGLGDIRIGMSVSELQSKFGATLEYDAYPEVKANACAYWKIPEHPNLGLMIVDGHLGRIEVDTDDYQTRSGAKIGMSEVTVNSIYGSWIQMEHHPYLGKSGSYLVLESRDRRYKMIFETRTPNDSGGEFASDLSGGPSPAKQVESFRAGLAEPVSYIEGCA